MATSTGPHTSPERDAEAPDRSVAALAAAGGLVVAVVVLVLLFGIARPPALAQLSEAPFPDLASGVAWNAWEQADGDRDVGQCLFVARPDGTQEQLSCDRLGAEVIAWDEQGVAQRSWDMPEEIVWYDPSTGDEVRRETVDDGRDLGPPRDVRISSRHEDGEFVVRREDTEAVLWSTSAPENYGINVGAISPGGEWVAMFDSAGRLLVLPADGSLEPRIWVEDAPGWEVPVWEGTPLPDGSS